MYGHPELGAQGTICAGGSLGTMIPPSVNRSQPRFSVDNGRIVYALGALKNVGVEAMRQLVAAVQAPSTIRSPWARLTSRMIPKTRLESTPPRSTRSR